MIFPNEVQEILDYFEATWIGRFDRRHKRRNPPFAHTMWSCYEAVLQDLANTNNSVEGWHRCFESQLSASQLSIWNFVDALKREESINTLKVNHIFSGAALTQKKK